MLQHFSGMFIIQSLTSTLLLQSLLDPYERKMQRFDSFLNLYILWVFFVYRFASLQAVYMPLWLLLFFPVYAHELRS